MLLLVSSYANSVVRNRHAVQQHQRQHGPVGREESPRSAVVVVRTGNYRVQGTNPNGSPYQGTLTIERSGALYQVRWKIGTDTYEGQGTLNGSTLTVDWGQPDPVIYQGLNDGT